jgi:uncharacterized protein (UPF0248 family)
MAHDSRFKALPPILFMVYGVLGKLKWRGGLESAEIMILHRGAPGDRKAVRGSDVLEVKQGFFTYSPDSRVREGPGASAARNKSYVAGREATVIPLHRVLEVRLDGKPVWKRARKV